MLTAMYATGRTTNRVGRNLVWRSAGSPYIPGKSTPLRLCNSATMRLMANSENVDSLPESDGIGQRNRGAIYSENHEGKKGATQWFRFGGCWWHLSEAGARACWS
jgi:hypothetical protein